jgi:Flp pilus assembly protein TadG
MNIKKTLHHERSDGKKYERGQSLIEFAFMLVLLLILLGAVVDGSRAMYTYLSMRDAAQEGAVYASLEPADTTGILDRIHNTSNLMQGLVIDTDIFVTITYPPSNKKCSGSTVVGGNTVENGVSVNIQYPNFPLIMPFVSGIAGGADASVPIGVTVIDTILLPLCP